MGKNTLPRLAMVVIGLAAFALYVQLLVDNPVVFWYDSHVRLAFPEQLVVGRWLPAVQAVVVVMHRVAEGVFPVRIVLAGLAVAVLAAAYKMVARMGGPAAGVAAAAMLAGNVMFASLATVVQPEVLFLGFLMLSFYFLDLPSRKGWLGAAVCINLACMARYEGILLAGLVVAESVLEPLRARNWRMVVVRGAQNSVVMGLAFLAWSASGVLYMEPRETQLAGRFTLPYWVGFLDQFWDLLAWQNSYLVLGLGALGVVCTWHSGWSRARAAGLRILLFLVANVALLGVLQPYSEGNLRQTFTVVVLLHCLAAYALVYLTGQMCELITRTVAPPWRQGLATAYRIAAAAAVLAASVFGLGFTKNFVAETSRNPDFEGAALAGDWLRGQDTEGAVIVALTDHIIQPYTVAAYSGLPFDRILSDDYSAEADIEAQLAGAGKVYVLAVQGRDAGLSESEAARLASLDGEEVAHVGPARVWVLDRPLTLNMLCARGCLRGIPRHPRLHQ